MLSLKALSVRGVSSSRDVPEATLSMRLRESPVMFIARKPSMPVPQDEPVIPVEQRKTMETLMAEDCRWPIGDPQRADFHFCGRTKVDGHPYCDFHVRRANQPTRPRAISTPFLTG